jgi:hypothetical protein
MYFFGQESIIILFEKLEMVKKTIKKHFWKCLNFCSYRRILTDYVIFIQFMVHDFPGFALN